MTFAGEDPQAVEVVGVDVAADIAVLGPVDTEVVELLLTGSRWDIRMAAVGEALTRLSALVNRARDATA